MARPARIQDTNHRRTKVITNKFETADGKYFIESYGNGWAYTVTCQRTGDNFFVQDSSAVILQQDTQNFDNTNVLNDYMEALGESQ
jgi:hypothetical protein